MREIVRSQKLELQELLCRKYVKRNGIETARKAVESGLVKVVTGPRRAGKSVFALQMLEGREFAYINFDDERLAGLTDLDALLRAIGEVYGDTRTFLFDEIQNLARWELFVNRLHRRRYNLVLTGSNAHLLSRELSTHLTGRYRDFRLLPFSFAEYLRAKEFAQDASVVAREQQGLLLRHLDSYLHTGGFPEVVLGAVEARNYLSTLFESILLKDVVKRYGVRHSGRLLELGRYLLSNHATAQTFTALKNALGFRSVHTVENYLGYLVEAYLVFCVQRFSWKAKERDKAPRKVYAVDPGMVGAVGFRGTMDAGRLLENIVAIELDRRGEDFFTFKTAGGKEVDFVVRRHGRVEELIQVCQDLSGAQTRKRELAGLLRASEELSCDNLRVITWDTGEVELAQDKRVSLSPAWAWLLRMDAECE